MKHFVSTAQFSFQERESRLKCVSNGKSRLSIKIFNYFTEHPLKRRATRRARAGSVRRQSSKTKRQGSVRSGSHSIGPGTTPGGKYIIQRSESLESNSCLWGPQFFQKTNKNHYPEHLLFRKYSWYICSDFLFVFWKNWVSTYTIKFVFLDMILIFYYINLV